MPTRTQGRRNLLTGKAGECAVASQLFLQGCPVMFSIVDLGVDLVAANGCRIQVKTAHINATQQSAKKYGRGVYIFPTPKTKRISVRNDLSRLVPKTPFAEVCDVVVFWGIEENRFWIVPATIADRVQAFILGPTDGYRFVGNVSDMREMIKLGYTHDQVAAANGCSRAIVTRLVNSDKDAQAPSAVSLARSRENAWELITDFNRSTAIVHTQPDSVLVQE